MHISTRGRRGDLPVMLWGLGFRAMVLALVSLLFLVRPEPANATDISSFYGRYTGAVDMRYTTGERKPRDMSVAIAPTAKGFSVEWTSISEKQDGRRKEKTYRIEFIASDRSGIYAAAMQRNVFGHEVQQDPMKGQPYVWARIEGETLTVFSMFIDHNGDYEMQQYDRTLTEGGLHLEFSSSRNGRPLRTLETELVRE